MALAVVRSFERWAPLAATLLLSTAVAAPVAAVQPPPSPPSSPQTVVWKPAYRPQPQLGWNPATDVPVVAGTPGDTTTLLVHAYYERWSGRLAALVSTTAAVDVPAPQAPDSAPPQIPRPYLHAPYRPQPQLGWSQETALQEPAPAPPPIAHARFTGYRPQPGLGWTAAVDVPEPPPTPPSSQTIPFAAGYRPQPGLGWAQATDVPAPTVDAPPSTPLRPYLHAPYRPQPQLGWNAARDVPPAPTSGDATELLVVAYYERWSGRVAASLLNPGAVDVPEVPPTLDIPQHPAPRPYLFGPYRLHPALGWAQALDAPQVAETPVFGRLVIERRRRATVWEYEGRGGLVVSGAATTSAEKNVSGLGALAVVGQAVVSTDKSPPSTAAAMRLVCTAALSLHKDVAGAYRWGLIGAAAIVKSREVTAASIVAVAGDGDALHVREGDAWSPRDDDDEDLLLSGAL